MQLLAIILGLATSASAIDIALRYRSGCDSRSGGHICTNINPDTCCGIPTGSANSAIIYAVPTEWFLEFRGHEGGNCGPVRTSESFGSATERCLNSGPYTGAGYSFRSSKREEQESACSLAPEGCNSSTMADVLFLSDGQKYNIANMDHGLVEELSEFAHNGSVAADIPEKFKPFEIAA
ncbi:hypothetical protein CJF30_00011354 [Rutstroemia sp. NJR-2017a BBW]|nr:hypothetical protein CJF30_00011354 [Rutstroemia sp. NJR-2017a BBW]